LFLGDCPTIAIRRPGAQAASLFPDTGAIHKQPRRIIRRFVEKSRAPRLTLPLLVIGR
jgi:hypothetical protein